jgi:DNA-binding response OmpR family regulator
MARKLMEDLMSSGSEAQRVLVIDDEADIADSLTDILILHGYDAVAFHDGLSAIESARTHCPHFIVSDVVMPKLNGVDTVAAIHEFCPEVRILLLSGQALTTDILEKARASGDEFEVLPKPIHPHLLLKKISLLMSNPK